MRSRTADTAEAIRQFLGRTGLLPGAPLPSTRALATELGLSHAAIVRACNTLISRSVLSRKGYKTIVGFASPVSPPIEGSIDIVSYTGPFFSKRVIRILAQRGVSHHLTELSSTQHPSPAAGLKKILAKRPTGVIFWSPWLDGKTEAVLKTHDVPMVICTDRTLRLNQSSISVDIYRGTEQALRHLYELGHRQIAHVSVPMMAPSRSYDFRAMQLADSHRAVCLGLNLRSSSALIWKMESSDEKVLRETILAGLRRHPEVTALFCEGFVGVRVKKFLSLPEQISVVVFGDDESSSGGPTLTRVTLPEDGCIALWACTEVISQIQTVQAGLPRKPPIQTMFVPELFLGASTKALANQENPSEKGPQSPVPRHDPEDTWRNVYPSLRKTSSDNWRPLDLSPLANHSMTRHHGWLGAEPLEHFPPGLRSIHGVPFQVLDEDHNDGRAVITFRSPHSHSADGRELPMKVRIGIKSCVKALYFLHGCGYAQPMAFARYIMHFKEGASVTVPLIPLGPSRRIALQRLGNLKPNLQDWWPAFEQDDFPHAHRAAVFNSLDPSDYERSLYSLEWINPRSRNELSFIEVRVDPDAGPALALIAVTALLT